ncbi:MAG: NAD(P)H-binding protein [Archangium sp.]|nr:NAD(P)H-binding protein [Archangium sp.]MDP3571420.1 NAD(P)H-binding protein [Archangium sp.]
MYAVAGVSGRTGAATANALLKQGQKVRVIVRNEAQAEPWAHKHVEIAIADLTDPVSLAAALKGVNGAFLLLPPNPAATDYLADRAAFLEKMITGVKKSGIKKLVFLSSIGAQHPAGTGPVVALHRAEKALAGIVPSVTFLRPGYFLENWANSLMHAIDTGELLHFGTVHVKFPQVGTFDIGVAAANALVENVTGTRHLELGGKENWSVEDVGVALTSLLNQPIKPVGLPVESAKDTLEKMGMLPGQAALYAEMYQGLARGLLAFAHPHGFLRGNTPLFDTLKTLV